MLSGIRLHAEQVGKLNVMLDKSKVRKNFDAAASAYDTVAKLQQHVAAELLDRMEVMRLAPKTILDLGSGTGRSSQHLGTRFPRADLVQVDIASQMLCHARQIQGLSPRKLSFLCADAEQIPLADNSVDLVFSSLMLQWCQEPEQVFAELKRIIRPGGLFIFSTLGPDTLYELRESWAAVDDGVHVNAFMDMHVVGDSLLHAGFVDPVVEVDETIVTYDSGRGLMMDLKGLGATNVVSNRRPGLTGKKRLSNMLREYETYRRDGKLPATYEVVYGHAWVVAGNSSSLPRKNTFAISLDTLKQTLSRYTGKDKKRDE